jgi:hypothetical protein
MNIENDFFSIFYYMKAIGILEEKIYTDRKDHSKCYTSLNASPKKSKNENEFFPIYKRSVGDVLDKKYLLQNIGQSKNNIKVLKRSLLERKTTRDYITHIQPNK